MHGRIRPEIGIRYDVDDAIAKADGIEIGMYIARACQVPAVDAADADRRQPELRDAQTFLFALHEIDRIGRMQDCGDRGEGK